MKTSTALQIQDMTLPINSIDTYVARVNQIPMLSAEEENALAHKFHQEQDLDAARHLVMAHLRFVARVARDYAGYGLPYADIVQEGNIGLMKAVKRFDPKVGVRLVSFAVHWIKAEIHEYVIRNWRIVKIATTKAQRKCFFNLRKMKSRLGWFSESEINDVADALQISPREVMEMEMRLNAHDAAFDGYTDDSDDLLPQAPAQYLEDQSANPALLFERDNIQSLNLEMLSRALEQLDGRAQTIIKERWLSEKKSTLHDLAAQFNVSAERIRQLEKQALSKLKDAFTN